MKIKYRVQILNRFEISFLLTDFTSDDQLNDRIVHRTERHNASFFLQKLKDKVCQEQKVIDDKNTLLGDNYLSRNIKYLKSYR